MSKFNKRERKEGIFIMGIYSTQGSLLLRLEGKEEGDRLLTAAVCLRISESDHRTRYDRSFVAGPVMW